MMLDTRTHQISHPLAGTLGEVMSQCEMVRTDQYELTIPNPEDWYGLPLFAGRAEDVHKMLVPGNYTGILENWAADTSATVKVVVTEHSTMLHRIPVPVQS